MLDLEDLYKQRVAVHFTDFTEVILDRKTLSDIETAAEKLKIPRSIDYEKILGLSDEGRTKMKQANPETLGQASRIPGVPPSDIQLLWIAIEKSHS